MLFINTRPSDRAMVLTQALDIPVLELPLLELVAYPWTESLANQYNQLRSAQVIVVVSPTAAQIGLKYLSLSKIDILSLKKIRWIAVGQATADILKQANIDAEIPNVESSEGMLSLLELQELEVSCIAFWRGLGGRQFMMDHLKNQGITVNNICLYFRRCPLDAQNILEHHMAWIKKQNIVFVCISSEASWLNWLNLCQKHYNLVHHVIYLVLGERLSCILKQYDALLDVRTILSLKPHCIQHAVNEAL